ncbi:hypothetical protein KBD49_05515 [Myxococcota bacterium]|nr:hypothetical protein [Myxococcota bacterium]
MSSPPLRRCSRCILPETWPGIRFDREGVCQQCRHFERRWGPWLADPEVRARARKAFDRAVERGRRLRRGRYDALVPVSGGKDSLEVLRIAREELHLDCLAYTYDNGLMTPGALENIRRVTGALGVPHVFDHRPEQRDLLRHFLRKTELPCGACFIPVVFGVHRMARREGIRLVLWGLARRNESTMPVGKDPWNFRNVVEDGMDLSAIRGIWGDHPVLDYAVDRARGRLDVVCVPDFFQWDDDGIRRNLGLRFGATFDGNHSDCLGARTMEWVWYRRYGFGAPTAMLSQQVRAGRITREEALEQLSRQEPPEFPVSIREVAEAAGMSVDEILAGVDRDQDRCNRGLMHRIAEIHRNWILGR